MINLRIDPLITEFLDGVKIEELDTIPLDLWEELEAQSNFAILIDQPINPWDTVPAASL